MKVSAIICEYNPLHNGHVHHIRETRANGATHVIGILSSNFVQRGDTALLDKFDRADLAVRAGMDLVIELPVAFSTASAEYYAMGAVSILNNLGIVDELSFGSSFTSNEKMELVTEAAISTSDQYRIQINELQREGYSYPAALCEVVRARYGGEVAKILCPPNGSDADNYDPNNLLAIEYIKALKKQNSTIQPFTIQRKFVTHDSFVPQDMYASASYIRRSILDGDPAYQGYVPAFSEHLLTQRLEEGRTADIRRLERVALYALRRMSLEEIGALPDVNASLQNRIYKARNAAGLDELLTSIKTKCFTMARIRRILSCAMIGIRKEDLKYYPPYARVLAFNNNGMELMGMIKRRSTLPISTSLAKLRETSDLAERFVKLEEQATSVRCLAQSTITSAEDEFRRRISAAVPR